ncbi:sulfur carrier protein ThiS [Aneurinibacillus terranovensis]|uniref:sulfur carrier protein ThiS n=1 Tax=Aneurinibacillus terranovensis TaxID=278991 RepID=UPI000417B710|nr:sulfur carrier protein ThiS [Aneurinibacillus terranovensis]
MHVIINGEAQTLPASIQTVKQLLEYLQLQDRIVVVEVNRSILEKNQHDISPVQDGDTIELVHFVGGG